MSVKMMGANDAIASYNGLGQDIVYNRKEKWLYNGVVRNYGDDIIVQHGEYANLTRSLLLARLRDYGIIDDN